MRVVDLDKLIAIKKTITLRMAITAGVIVGVPVFLVALGAGFGAALLALIFLGGGLFGLVFGIRTMVDRGVEKRRMKLGALEGDVIDVMLNREYGLLEFFDNMVVFHNLTPGGNEKKRLEIPLTEETFIHAGQIQDRVFEKFAYKDIPRGFVVVRASQYSVPTQFVFVNIDNALDHVAQVVNTISKFQG